MRDGCQCPGAPTIYINAAAGDSVCTRCGSVISENALVSEVTFGETSGGAAMAHGTLVAEGSTHARTGGWRRGGEESNEQAIYNGRIRISQVSTAMSIPDTIRDSALRFYKLAVAARFTKGRKSRLVVAACLYAACQRVKFGYMLIDFSDLLQVNVFVLGSTYLRLIKVLHLPRPHEIDPSHYIYRFASLLEFGDETNKVAEDASRLVRRFKADWMNTGRRPAGICGACLLLAARMNNFRRSVQEIVQVVKIADQTLLKRLDEFKSTGSSNMTVNTFRDEGNWEMLEPEIPPVIKEQEFKRLKRLARKKKRDGLNDDQEEDIPQTPQLDVDDPPSPTVGLSPEKAQGSLQSFTPAVDLVFNEEAFQDVGFNGDNFNIPEFGEPGSSRPLSLFIPEQPQDTISFEQDAIVDPALYDQFIPTEGDKDDGDKNYDVQANDDIAGEVETVLHGAEGARLAAELDEAEAIAVRRNEDTDLLEDLDDDELDAFILTEDEVRIKTRVWCELNRDYLEKLAAKGLDETGEEQVKKAAPKPKKPKQKPRDSTTARGTTPAESVGHLLQKKTFSRKINYDAVKNLFKTPASSSRVMAGFESDSAFGAGSTIDDEEKDDEAGLSTIDPDPEPERPLNGYMDVGEGYQTSFAPDEYYDDGGYEEEV